MPRVTALIPSHNEEVLLPAALRALETQTVAVDRIVVVSDNSTDETAAIAAGWGGRVELFETCGNRDRKAGALNQALSALIPHLADDDWVLVMDADSRVAQGFIARAQAAAGADPRVGAVGGIFLACGERTLLERLQAHEYVRYAREIARDGARAKVLTGTATMSSVRVLKAVAAARAEGRLPGRGIYHSRALCEDFELTLALKSLGHRCVSPKECLVRTEVMPTAGALWRQRTRWQRGALQCLRFYGLSRVTLPYIAKQIEMTAGLLATGLLLLLSGWALRTGTLTFQPVWVALSLVFFVERIVSVWRAGRTGRLITLSVLPDLLYDYLISAVFIYVWAQVALRREGQWGLATIDNGRNQHVRN